MHFKFRGRPNTKSPLNGGYYDFIFSIPKNFPIDPPKVKALNNFLHMHVYYGGDIDLPIINPQHYKVSITFWDIAT